jgi:nitroreductase
MEAYEAIITRRMVPKVGAREPDRESIQKILEAAVRAPTHHLTQPWRFIVLRGRALEEWGRAWANGAAREGKDPDATLVKARRAPVVIAVVETPKHHLPKVQEIEEHHATGAAIQNMLLAAHSLGLGAMLRTGPAAHIPEVREHLAIGEGELVAGFIYLGYPPENDDRPMTRRADPATITEWRGWE